MYAISYALRAITMIQQPNNVKIAQTNVLVARILLIASCVLSDGRLGEAAQLLSDALK